MTVPLSNIGSDLDEITKGLSDKVRQIVFGLLAFVWIFLSGGPNVPTFQIATSNRPLLGIAGLCVASLCCDLLQSFSSYLNAHHILRAAEKAGLKTTQYDKNDWRYRTNLGFFYMKLALGFVAAIWMVVLFVLAVTR